MTSLAEARDLAERLAQRNGEWCEHHMALPPDHEALDAAQTIGELLGEIEKLRQALEPFTRLADTWTVQNAAKNETLLTVSNGERMCGISAAAFIEARKALEADT